MPNASLSIDGTEVIRKESGVTTLKNTIVDNNVQFPAGHVIQFKYVTTTTEYLTASMSVFTDFTALDLNITPTHANSKLLIVLAGTFNHGTQNNITTRVESQINSSNTLAFANQRTNTNAIVDVGNYQSLQRIYEHGQTSSFSQLTLTWRFIRWTVASNYGETSFNSDAQFDNTAIHYVMEIV